MPPEKTTKDGTPMSDKLDGDQPDIVDTGIAEPKEDAAAKSTTENKVPLMIVVMNPPTVPTPNNTNKSASEETSEDQIPVQQTPKDQTPAQQAPAQQAPAQQTPAQQTPARQTPKDQTPKDQTPKDQTPAQQTPEDQTPAQQTPEDQVPEDQTPEDQTPAQQTPAQEPPKKSAKTKGDEPIDESHSYYKDTVMQNDGVLYWHCKQIRLKDGKQCTAVLKATKHNIKSHENKIHMDGAYTLGNVSAILLPCAHPDCVKEKEKAHPTYVNFSTLCGHHRDTHKMRGSSKKLEEEYFSLVYHELKKSIGIDKDHENSEALERHLKQKLKGEYDVFARRMSVYAQLSSDPWYNDKKDTKAKATKSKATESKATESKATESKATEPKATESKATQTQATGPQATEPKATESKATQTQSTEPELKSQAEANGKKRELGDEDQSIVIDRAAKRLKEDNGNGNGNGNDGGASGGSVEPASD